ncbi:catechol 1,2-dioxygenase [Pseudomonas aeruginosa]|uniref:catechol 1,2-dioxygenase n=1 Tax=Pseudomonas aeruginosa TaxID=287 RepID=UPI000877675D|nr:catechol 1,2-dioxygenase [Pseudomonas aeruginosa]
MTVKISQTADVQRFFEEASGQLNERGDPRTKALVRRVLDDTAKLIEEMQVTPDEFWKAVDYLNRLGSRQEAGLLAAGLGLEHYLDLLLDAQDAEAGLTGGTPRTIEGPLYVAGAPLSDGEARMDDGRDPGTVMFLQGRVSGPDGQPLAAAIVDVWHANTQGTYSYFDSSQSEYNLRRRIRTDADGRYRARSIVPSGYGCPSDGPTQELLDRLGRHGQRPAHIHFFVSAPGHRHLTTQINLAGDRYLWDDFAYATRDGLIGDLRFNDDPAAARDRGVEGGRFAELDFDFQLQASPAPAAERRSQRPRALQE